jgi:hypothetical protein
MQGLDLARNDNGLSRIARDAPLYGFILAYTLAGLAFVHYVGAWDRAAYAIYVNRWAFMFGLFMPLVAILVDGGTVIHRFNHRRRLAFRRMFSARRLSCLFAGVALLMAMILFQGTFTSVKNALTVWQGGFPHDRIQADIDAWLHFGTDPWRWLFAVAQHERVLAVVEWNYNVLWFVLCFGMLFYVATSPRTEAIRTRYILCFMLAWIVCGNLFAGPFLSAGPAFYGLVTGDETRFAEQMAFLALSEGSNHSAVSYQNYLWQLHEAGKTGFGSGISAFPSVHVALIALNVLFAFEYSRRLGVLASAYLVVIIASSVYLAWHYAIDGYASVAIVAVIYVLARRWMVEGDRSVTAPVASPDAGVVAAIPARIRNGPA